MRMSGETLQQRYEQLRAQVVSGRTAWGQAVGLGRLVGFGVRGWMERGLEPWSPPRGSSASHRAKPAGEHDRALGGVIADMILAPWGRIWP